VKKKAALTLLRLFRKNPDALTVSLKDWSPKIISLLDESDLVGFSGFPHALYS